MHADYTDDLRERRFRRSKGFRPFRIYSGSWCPVVISCRPTKAGTSELS